MIILFILDCSAIYYIFIYAFSRQCWSHCSASGLVSTCGMMSRAEQSAGPYHCEIIIINFPSSIQTIKGKSRKTESLKNVVLLGEW